MSLASSRPTARTASMMSCFLATLFPFKIAGGTEGLAGGGGGGAAAPDRAV